MKMRCLFLYINNRGTLNMIILFGFILFFFLEDDQDNTIKTMTRYLFGTYLFLVVK